MFWATFCPTLRKSPLRINGKFQKIDGPGVHFPLKLCQLLRPGFLVILLWFATGELAQFLGKCTPDPSIFWNLPLIRNGDFHRVGQKVAQNIEFYTYLWIMMKLFNWLHDFNNTPSLEETEEPEEQIVLMMMNLPLVFQLVGCVSPLYPIICHSFHF